MKEKQSLYFRFLRRVVRLFTKKIDTVWAEPFSGEPSVFVCNHDRAMGPIAMCAHFDMCSEVRPWITAPVLSAKTVPAHVRGDNWWAPDKWYSKILNYTIVYPIAAILPPILRGSRCIPIYYDMRMMVTFRESIKTLQSGKQIVLFPEHSTGYKQYQTEVVGGFVALGRMFYHRTKQCLNFYPTFVDWSGKIIRVAKPIVYDPLMKAADFTQYVTTTVEDFFTACGNLTEAEPQTQEKTAQAF